MLKQCRGCGHLFLPKTSADAKCGLCARPRPIFDRKPVDLWLQWAERDHDC